MVSGTAASCEHSGSKLLAIPRQVLNSSQGVLVAVQQMAASGAISVVFSIPWVQMVL